MPKICHVCNRSYSDDHVFCPADGTTLRADVSSDLIGSVIADRYLVTDLLGEGGMGRVYLGQHVRLPQQAAIKVLRADLVQDTGAIARFNREATSTSRIQSEHVARVFDFGETPDRLVYIAMEFVPGRTLRKWVETEGPLPLPRVVGIIAQVADGLDAAHRLGIVHRDLKPDNVIVAHDEEMGDRAKVVDFGIAKAMGSGDGSLTSTGFIIGTPDYMSPEQLLNETIDARSDVYALGLVAYYLLTGVLPFRSDGSQSGLMARLVEEPLPLNVSHPHGMWSLQIQQVFNTVLARDVKARFATAREFAHALRECAGGMAPASGTGTASYDADRFAATGAATSGTAAPAFTSGAAAVPGVKSPASSASGNTSGSSPGAKGTASGGVQTAVQTGKAPSRNRAMYAGAGVLAVATIAIAAFVITQSGGNNTPPAASGDVAATPATLSDQGVRDTLTASGAGSGDSTPSLRVATDNNVPPATPQNASSTPATNPAAPPTGRDAAARDTRVANDRSTATVSSAAFAARIDSVMRAFDDLAFVEDDVMVARRSKGIVQQIDDLLRRAPAAPDSARLLLLAANAHKLGGDTDAACATLQRANAVASSNADRNSVTRNRASWGCTSPWR